MVAGLPGIGVGTLFYVLTALWMPISEMAPLLRGKSSVARWKRIGVQFGFALSIIASVAAAERVLLWILGAATPGTLNPARLVNHGMESISPETMLAAPIAASLVLLALILLVVQLQSWAQRVGSFRAGRNTRRAVAADSTVSPYAAPAP